ncbi:hypothetical protein Pmani_005939 [Petrolisthes manimaculis]|uniref:Uncharacterized protein n=1 Tax=Petrolisthes manimaculis TaxID=1843537 RepID=A0AAE1QB93_9EUCA|nr:hypothetical protein Pmani_005939 [Petrolisthes manimaculis]
MRQDSQETGGGPSTETKLNPVEKAMAGTLKDVQMGGVSGVRDPGASENDTDEDEVDLPVVDLPVVELPSVQLPPGPSVPSVATEPAGMIRSAATSVLDTIAGTPAIPSVGSYQDVSGTSEQIPDHSYSEQPSRRHSQASRVRQMTLAPEMLDIQTQILHGVLQISESLIDIAKSLRKKCFEE